MNLIFASELTHTLIFMSLVHFLKILTFSIILTKFCCNCSWFRIQFWNQLSLVMLISKIWVIIDWLKNYSKMMKFEVSTTIFITLSYDFILICLSAKSFSRCVNCWDSAACTLMHRETSVMMFEIAST